MSATGIILVDHGSRLATANDMLLDVVAMFQRVTKSPIVEAAHMELAAPSIPDAFDKCVAQGATTVIIHPYFLSPGRHSTTDIPRIVAEAAARHPGIAFHVTPPLGLDEKIAHIIQERIQGCTSHNFNCDYCATRQACQATLAAM